MDTRFMQLLLELGILFLETLPSREQNENKHGPGDHSLSPGLCEAYVLMDSWYTNPGALDTYKERGRYLIVAMKNSHFLFPDRKRTSAADLASSLAPGSFHPVTVKGCTYMA